MYDLISGLRETIYRYRVQDTDDGIGYIYIDVFLFVEKESFEEDLGSN